MTQHPDDGEPEMPHGEQPFADEPVEKMQVTKIAPAWLISVAVHAAIALIFSMVLYTHQEKIVELPPRFMRLIDTPPDKPKEQHREIDRTLDKTQQLVVETETENNNAPTQIQDDIKVDQIDQSNDPIKGREDAVSSIETGGLSGLIAIGVGGGGAGKGGTRTGSEKQRILRSGGPSKPSEYAVDAALRWFKRHQSSDGSWDPVTYYQNCTDGQKCEPGSLDSSNSDVKVAITGYAILCFLGAGYDHQSPNKYRSVVDRAITWLKAQQKSDGMFGNRNYELAIATQALADAYGMNSDPELREPVQKAVNVLLERQNKGATPMGWNYTTASKRHDSSVTGWCVMALKTAMNAGINVGKGMSGASEWLRQTYEISNPNHAQLTAKDEALFTYSWSGNKIETGQNGASVESLGSRVPMGALCAVFLGHHKGDKMLETMINYITSHQMYTSWPANAYYLYYNTMAVFQSHGTPDDPIWQRWNGTIRDMLVQSQRRDGCFDGSWDAGKGFAGAGIGRTLSTAYCCLSLEVYYRQKQIATH